VGGAFKRTFIEYSSIDISPHKNTGWVIDEAKPGQVSWNTREVPTIPYRDSLASFPVYKSCSGVVFEFDHVRWMTIIETDYFLLAA